MDEKKTDTQDIRNIEGLPILDENPPDLYDLDDAQIWVGTGSSDPRTDLTRRTQESISPSDQERLSTLKSESLTALEVNGLIEIGNDSQGRFIVLNDPEIFRRKQGEFIIDNQKQTLNLSNLLRLTKDRLYSDRTFGKGNIGRTFYFMFKDERVITRSELVEAEKKGEKPNFRSLIYTPDNEKSALGLDPDGNIDLSILRQSKDKYYFLYTEIAGRYDGVYPTKDMDFASSLSAVEGMLPQLIYGLGDGLRQTDNGPLFVKRFIRRPIEDGDNDTRRLSGSWFEDNGMSFVRNRPDSGTIRQIMAAAVPRLIQLGLIRIEDFPASHTTRKDTVDDYGQWYKPGSRTRYTLGDKCIGGDVIRINNNEYIVLVNGKPLIWFDTNIPENKRHNVLTYKSGHRIVTHATQDAFEHNDISGMDFTVIRFAQGERRKMRVRMASEIIPLIDFYQEFLSRFGNTDMLDKFSLKDQVAIHKIVKSFNSEKSWNFISRFQEQGLTLLRDGFYHDGFDPAILDLVDRDDFKVKEYLIPHYIDFMKTIVSYEKSLTKSMQEITAENSFNTTNSVFTSRIAESFRKRAHDFISAAARPGYLNMATEELLLLTQALEMTSMIYDHNLITTDSNQVIENRPAGSTTADFVSLTYKDQGGNSIKILFRPYEKRTGNYRAHARMSFEYSRFDGARTSFRVDLDPYGLSLDLGSQQDHLTAMLSDLGMDHHTPEPFDRAFEDNLTYASLVKTFAQAAGYDFSAISQP